MQKAGVFAWLLNDDLPQSESSWKQTSLPLLKFWIHTADLIQTEYVSNGSGSLDWPTFP